MITSKHIKPNGLVNLYDKIEKKVVEMAPVDATHALHADLERWHLGEHPPVEDEEKDEE